MGQSALSLSGCGYLDHLFATTFLFRLAMMTTAADEWLWEITRAQAALYSISR